MKKSIFLITALACGGILTGCQDDPKPTERDAWNQTTELSFPESEKTVSKEGGIVVFSMQTNQVAFKLATDDVWYSAYTLDNDKVVVTVQNNRLAIPRTGTIRIQAGPFDNDENVQTLTVSQEPGDIRLPALGDVVNGGIVFWSQEEPVMAYKVLSLNRIYGTTAKWSEEQVVTGATSPTDGEANQAVIAARDISKYPSFAFCANMAGGGWYLPSQNEFLEVVKLFNGGELPSAAKPEALSEQERAARAAFEKKLADNGGDVFNDKPDNDNGNSYWTSTESSDKNGIYVRVGAYATGAGAKTGTARGARCVKYYEVQ